MHEGSDLLPRVDHTTGDDAQYEELVALCKRSRWQVAREDLGQLVSRRSRHLMAVLGELNDCNVQLFRYKQGVDTSTSTPMGSMLWQFLGIFAEFGHGIRRERQAIGIAKARERGVRFGRPKLSRVKELEVIKLRRKGLASTRSPGICMLAVVRWCER